MREFPIYRQSDEWVNKDDKNEYDYSYVIFEKE